MILEASYEVGLRANDFTRLVRSYRADGVSVVVDHMTKALLLVLPSDLPLGDLDHLVDRVEQRLRELAETPAG